MRIYIASRFIRQEEMRQYANILIAKGHEITSSWIFGEGGSQEENKKLQAGELDPDLADSYAQRCLADILNSNCLINFSEKPLMASSGGAQVELGVAICLKLMGNEMRLISVNHKQNLFHHLAQVEFFPSLESLLEVI